MNNIKRLNTKLITYNVNMKDNSVFVNIPNSIVKNQTEYMPDLNLLTQIMEKNGFRLILYKDINEEFFLNNEERVYTSMFSSIVYERYE